MATKKNEEEVPDVSTDAVEVNEEVAESTNTTPDSKIVEMASAVLSGDIFPTKNEDGEIDLTDILEFRAKFGKFLTGLKGVGKEFDEQLVKLRQAHGSDYLSGVEYFRKPRQSKSGGNSLLDDLTL